MSLLSRISSSLRGTMRRQRLFSGSSAAGMLTHTPSREIVSMDEIREKLDSVCQSLQKNAALSPEQRISFIKDAQALSQFELGRFLIANDGALSGWWTYYCILGWQKEKIQTPLERFILQEAPTVLATRERFHHFQDVMKKVLENAVHSTEPLKIASIPGGIAADLMNLSCSVDPSKCRLQFVNIDLDRAVLDLAKNIFSDANCSIPLECLCEDAWSLSRKNEFDLVTSNGLNIYVPDRDRVVALYRSFLSVLKPGGVLVTSVLTPPPGKEQACEWNMDKIDKVALARQAGIFAHILKAKWSNFCSTQDMMTVLSESGFENIKVIPDSRNMFPTFVGEAPAVKMM